MTIIVQSCDISVRARIASTPSSSSASIAALSSSPHLESTFQTSVHSSMLYFITSFISQRLNEQPCWPSIERTRHRCSTASKIRHASYYQRCVAQYVSWMIIMIYFVNCSIDECAGCALKAVDRGSDENKRTMMYWCWNRNDNITNWSQLSDSTMS